ncbi:MAG TPA: hypothetical protein DCP20_01945 [Coriobacteriia bacterium]|jgi:hypothetical protein|nr:MAG: hypothetical protein XD74_1696 [Actinobacteria bacterium 66_15]HAL29461.1 hypothetical protein [Coriobacteriia bacterium]
MRRLLLLTASVVFLAGLMAGCSQPGERNDSQVRVPDVVAAVRSHDFRADYADDAKMAAIARSAYVDGALEAADLKADLVSVPGRGDDTQDPPAGTMVEPGTTVTVRLADEE